MPRSLLSLLLSATALLCAAEWSIELKDLPDDYGCGSKNMMLYCQKGIPSVGCFVGHANPLTRNDRVLMRFDLGEYYLLEQLPEVKSAWLEFTVHYRTANADGHQLFVEHLDYEREAFAKEDLAADEATTVAQEPIAEKRYRLDVTAAVKHDLAARRLHAAFRFAATCGNAGNTSGQPIGCEIRVPVEHAGNNPRLVLEF